MIGIRGAGAVVGAVLSVVMAEKRVLGAHADVCDLVLGHLASFGLPVEAKGRVPS